MIHKVLCYFLLTAALKLIFPLARSCTQRNWRQLVVQTYVICRAFLQLQS